jgi:hypothetical protein
MGWSLSASGVVGDVLGEAAAALEPAAREEMAALAREAEAELVAELRKVLSNPKFRVVSTFFNGRHTGTVSDLHVAAAPAPAEPAPAPAEQPAPEPAGAPAPVETVPEVPGVPEPAEEPAAGPGPADTPAGETEEAAVPGDGGD